MKGSCLCKAVSYDAEPDEMTVHACHCDMCRPWTGSMTLAVAVSPGGIRFQGDDNIRTFVSSSWAERAWCDRCGSALYFRITAEGPHQGRYHMALGTFDDPGAFEFNEEIFIDRKPPNYAFAGERRTKTAAEVAADFADHGDGTE